MCPVTEHEEQQIEELAIEFHNFYFRAFNQFGHQMRKVAWNDFDHRHQNAVKDAMKLMVEKGLIKV